MRKKTLKTLKAQFRFLGFSFLCNLINKPYIKILIVICEILQFHNHFYMVFFSFAHWRFVFSKVRRTVYGIVLCALGRTFVFSLHTKNLKPKNL